MNKLDAVITYNLINNGKFGKMSKDESFKLLKILRSLKPIVIEYEDFSKTVIDKYKTPEFDQMVEKGKAYENNTGDITKEEYDKIIVAIKEYNEKVNNALLGDLTLKIDITFDKLSEEGFKDFLTANEFKLSEASILMEILL